ncbi:hypothetical protein AB9J70_17440 [Elizabethkingia anophelis]|uniref:hypothetical protein n=1 Tax=Elizabethkingia anophelis TaxID=1117645 RepID=UPI0035569F73
MKNQKLISQLRNLQNTKSLESIEGAMLRSIKGGNAIDPCGTKCKPNTSCNSNNKPEESIS